jgi:hypothetical protein
MPERLDHLALFETVQASFARELASADPEAPVDACGDWRVADLALHLGSVYWWAAALAVGSNLSRVDATKPRDIAGVARFYTWAAQHTLATLIDIGPDPLSRTLLGPGPAAFWRRRALHETLIHLVDLRVAGGTAPRDATADTSPVIWADGIDEVVTMMQPRRTKGAPLARPIGLVADDADGAAWTLGLSPGRADARPASSADRQPGREEAILHGPAWMLALLLWHRIDLRSACDQGLVLEGATSAVDDVLAGPLVP